MASIAQLVCLSFLICITLSQAQTSAKPKALILPLSKDAATLQYTTHLGMGTPLVQKKLVVDLDGKHLWIDCETDYKSSTYKPGRCGSASCSAAKAFCAGLCPGPAFPGCNNNTCKVVTENSIRGSASITEIALDAISLPSTDGVRSGKSVSVPNFIFGCDNIFHLDNLATGSKGMLGLSKNQVALPPQLSSAFGGSFRRKFAICLPSTSKSDGVMFFGDSPYVFYPSYNTSKAIDVSESFTTHYTRLQTNYERTASPRVQGAQMPGYFVKVNAILVNNNPIPINTSLLEFRRTGIGGSSITTVQPYTILDSTIYSSLVKAFEKEMATLHVTKAEPVAPFKDCYNTKNISRTPLGLSVPDIAFVFENRKVYWEMYGGNSMVEINRDVACLAFVDGGVVGDFYPALRTAITFGAHQLQDNLIQFDLASNRVGFTSSLLLADVECSNFKF